MENDILSEKYAISLLIYLFNKNSPVNKDELRKNVVKSVSSLDKLLDKLRENNLINIKEEIIGRRTYFISLTDKGKTLSGLLKEVEKINESSSESLTEFNYLLIKIPIGIYQDLLKMIRIEKNWKDLEDLILESIKEKLEKWKKDHVELINHP
jgi:DNA-binding MarR family transcriptional regulator